MLGACTKKAAEPKEEAPEENVEQLMQAMVDEARRVRRDSGKHRLVGGKLVLPGRSYSEATTSCSPASLSFLSV